MENIQHICESCGHILFDANVGLDEPRIAMTQHGGMYFLRGAPKGYSTCFEISPAGRYHTAHVCDSDVCFLTFLHKARVERDRKWSISDEFDAKRELERSKKT